MNEGKAGVTSVAKGFVRLVAERRSMLIWFGVLALLLVFGDALSSPEEFFLNPGLPDLNFDYAPITLLFAALIAVGLNFGLAGPSKVARIVGSIVAQLTAAYALAILGWLLFAAWLAVADRADSNYRALNVTWAQEWLNWLGKFINVSDQALLFFLGLLTPTALVMFAGVAIFLMSPIASGRPQAQRLATPIFWACAGVGACLLGGMVAWERFPRSEISTARFVYPALPVIVLGALVAWVVAELAAPMRPTRPHRFPKAGNLEKVLSSASRTSVIVLVLIYLGITQISGYADRLSRLVEAREAFAHDMLASVTASSVSGIESVRTENSSWVPVQNVPWGTVKVVKYDSDPIYYWAEVTEELSKESWSARALGKPGENSSDQMRQIAEKNNVAVSAGETAIDIYPRVEAQLTAKEIDLPGAGFSIDLGTFSLLAPFIVAATLVVLGGRLELAIQRYVPQDDPWILLDGRRGLVGLLAWSWLGALLAGPWLLAVIVIQTVGIAIRTKGAADTSGLDALYGLYVIAAVAALLVPSQKAFCLLLQLRCLARSRS